MSKVTFCGHVELPHPETVRAWLSGTVESLIRRGAKTLYLGGYGAFDRVAAGVVRSMKAKYPYIEAVLVLAYLDRKIEAELYDSTAYPPLETVPRRFAISKRNEWMIDHSDVVVACVLHDWGGAAKTLEYAKRKRKQIIRYTL